MTRTALAFFVLAIFSVLVGASGITGISIEIIKIISMVFLILGVLSYAGNLVNERKRQVP